MASELASDDQLRVACKRAMEVETVRSGHQEWVARMAAHLARVRSADRAAFLRPDFQRDLWESEAISATGMGQVDVSGVIASAEIADSLWDLKSQVLDPDPMKRAKQIAAAWDELSAKVKNLTDRTPRLKMYRVFAALFPSEFTTIAHQYKIRQLAKKLGVQKGTEHPVELHMRVLERLRAVVGDFGPEMSPQWLEKLTLPWALYVDSVQEGGDEATEQPGKLPGADLLKPLPAERRRRGLLSISGGLSTVRAMIEFASEGCKREDFREHVKSVSPQLADPSISTTINALIAEWGVLKAVGDDLVLTPRGEALLETGEQEEVSDWLLTRILGFDNLLYLLKGGSQSSKQAIEFLKQVNPGWTSNYLPTSMINWVKTLGLAEVGDDKSLHLTSRGKAWTERIHWTPGSLPAVSLKPAASPEQAMPRVTGEVPASGTLSRPTLKEVIATFPPEAKFEDSLIARLDAGLWSHHRRHFAVLTGLSGAGKTLLARRYALGLWAGETEPKTGVLTVPVQPGWHDPSSLLGYVNPLNTQTYVKTRFLEFILEAIRDPERPYTAILDEMNLSHPEQYLAPLLSAMETGDEIELHAQGDEIEGIPSSIPYPSNLLLIGTVNMDETTHGLSDKVLDRASVIEFWDIDVDEYPSWNSAGLAPDQVESVRSVLRRMMDVLRPVRLHFGWRTIDDVLGYVRTAATGGVIHFEAALDHAVHSKVLPKLRGEDSPKLQKALQQLREVLIQAKLTESEAKLEELIEDLKHLGSARFWR